MVTLKAVKSLKPKRCKECGNVYTPERSLQSVCSPGCAIARARKTREKQVKREIRDAKEKGKTRREWLKCAHTIFNKIRRIEDGVSRGGVCISCGSKTGKQNCGHYRSVGSCPELRFEPLNTYLQCEKCNSYLSGNLINYRMNLIKLIGEEKVNWLEGSHEPLKLTIDELKIITEEYRIKLSKLIKDNNGNF